MSRVRGKNTTVELKVRRLLHRSGYRYRIHVPTLPGRPDIVFPARRKIVLVHGCFWHSHKGCALARVPKSNVSFWLKKLGRNQERDQETLASLLKLGWSVLIVWECETDDEESLLSRLIEFLKD